MIENWMPVLKAKIKEIQGLEGVRDYTDLPGSLQEFPLAIIMPTAGDLQYSAGGPCLMFTDVVITIYTAGQILPEAMSQAVPFISLVRDKLAANIQLNNTVHNIGPVSDGRWFEGPGQIEYANKNHVGIMFRYTVKENINTELTVSA